MIRKPPRVLVTIPLASDLLQDLKETFEVAELAPDLAKDPSHLAASLRDYDGCLLGHPTPIQADLFDQCRNLRVISKVGVGYENIDVAAATQRGVLVCNTPGVLVGAVADMTFALLLALSRRLRENESLVRQGDWQSGHKGVFGRDIRGNTLGLVGLGGIGREVANTARGFRMRVLYFKPRRDAAAEEAGVAEYRSRAMLFSESDVVSIHCPLTPETRRSIGREEFSWMKPSSFFINTSRGGVVDHDALLDALLSGTIAGAGLDVTDPEPLPADHPLCGLPNVVITPHIGSATTETRRAMHELAVNNLIGGLIGIGEVTAVNPEVSDEVRLRDDYR